MGSENPASLDSLKSLGLVLEAEGKWAESEAVHREALAALRERGEDESSQALSLLESLTRVLAAQKKFIDAEQLVNEALTPEFVKQPSSAGLLDIRVDLKARREKWQEAAVDAARAFEHQPSNHNRYSMLAALLVKTQNRSAYDQFCQRILATFGNTTNAFVADQVAKACLFVPSTALDLAVIGRLADTAVTLGAGNDGAMPFFQLCKALSEYRKEHFAEAVEWAKKPLKVPHSYIHGHAYAVLAMAYWHLGDKDAAREMLAKGETLAPNALPKRIAEDPGNAWLAWLFARIWLEEAAALIQSPVPAGTAAEKQ